MIIKGGARAGAGNLAAHLLRLDTNEHMHVRELRDVAGVNLTQALRELEAHGSAIRCKSALYHVSISPRADEVLTPAQWARSIDRLEAELGLTGQPRVVVEHIKYGRAHVHAVWSRIDLDRMRAVSDSWNFAKHEQVARELEREFGLSRVQGAHAERDGVPRPARTPSPAEMSQSERSGIAAEDRKAELTALWLAAGDAEAFADAAAQAGYQLARGDRRAYVVVETAGEVYALARQLAGVTTAAVKARLAALPPGAVPVVEEACAVQAARTQARKDAPPAMDQPPGSTLEEQRLAELVRLQEIQAAAQKSEAEKADAIRREQTLRDEQIAHDEQQKRQEVERIAGLAREFQAAELAKLEAAKLEQLRETQERAAAYMAERERQVEQARRAQAAQAEQAQAAARAAEIGRVREGAIRNASDRYTQALGQHYDVANPYGSLARAAMAEAGAFSRDQEALRQQTAAEEDPGKRELLTLRREIEAKEHFAQAGNRVARINEALTGQPDRHWQVFASEQAAEAVQLREQYRAVAAEQERTRAEAQRQELARQAELTRPPAPSPEVPPPRPPAAAQEKADAPPTESRPAPAAHDRQAQKDQAAQAALAQEHAKQREALDQRQASDTERKALEERQRQEQRRLELLQTKREIERQQAKESGREP